MGVDKINMFSVDSSAKGWNTVIQYENSHTKREDNTHVM